MIGLFLTVKPKIDRTHLKQTTIKAGRNVKLDIKIEGEPVPTVKWVLNNSPVSMICICKSIYFLFL